MPLLAAIASFLFPGAGQALSGRWRLAALWAGASMVPILAMFLWVPLLFLHMAIRFAAAIDAGIRVKRAAPGTQHLWLAAIVAGAVAASMGVVREWVFEGFKVPASSMTPTLEIGDHFFVNKLATPERGDIVVFWHPTGRTYVKRLIAVGGDVVAVRDDVLHVNGGARLRRDLGPTTYRDYDDGSDSWDIKEAQAFEETLGDHRYRVYQARRAPGETGDRHHDFPRTDDAFFSTDGDPCASVPMLAEERAAPPRPQMRLSADGKGCVVPDGTAFLLGDNRDNSNDSRYWGVIRTSDIVGVVFGKWWPMARIGNVE